MQHTWYIYGRSTSLFVSPANGQCPFFVCCLFLFYLKTKIEEQTLLFVFRFFMKTKIESRNPFPICIYFQGENENGSTSVSFFFRRWTNRKRNLVILFIFYNFDSTWNFDSKSFFHYTNMFRTNELGLCTRINDLHTS